MKALPNDFTGERADASAAVPPLPRRVAIVDASPSGGDAATAFLLGDFAEAFAAYARHGALDEGSIPALERFPSSDDEAAGLDAPMRFDTVVLGLAICADGPTGRPPRHMDDLFERIRKAAVPGARVYAVCSAKSYGAGPIEPSFEALERSCAQAGLSWCGGLAVGGSAMIDGALRGAPRMGGIRRRLSEATDRLILAVRCGEPAGIIETNPPIPRFAYSIFVEARRRREAGANGAAGPEA